MPHFIMLSPHYPPRLFPFASRLRDVGFTVTGIGDANFHQLPGELQAALTEYHRLELHCYCGLGTIDDGRYDPILRTVAGLVSRHGRPEAIESFNEFWLPLEARLRDDFNVPGLRPADLETCIRKSKMKEVFRQCGVATVPGELVGDLAQVQAFMRREGTIIIKPDIGVGASDTHRIDTPAQAEAFMAQRDPNRQYFMERFIQGPDRQLLSYDGLADRDGEVVFATVHPVNDGLLEIVAGTPLAYHNLLPAEIPAALREAGARLVRAFGLRRRFFHIEFFKVGEVCYGLEVNARPPGVLTLDMMNHAHGIDLWAEYARIAVGGRGPVQPTRTAICSYVARMNHHRYRFSHDDLLRRFGDRIVMHRPMDSAVMGDYAYLFLSADHQQRQAAIADITALA